MRYVCARLRVYRREQAYRVYITDSFYLDGQNKAFTKRWCDIVEDIERGNAVEEDAETIIAQTLIGAGLTRGGDK